MNKRVPIPGAEKKFPRDLLTEVRRSTDNEIQDGPLRRQNDQRLTGKRVPRAEVEATMQVLQLVIHEVDAR